MKQNKLLLLVFTFISIVSLSQNKSVVGINAGINYSSLRGEIIEFESELDFLFGVKYSYPIKNNLSIKGELNYERKSMNREILPGENTGNTFSSGDVRLRRKYEYISLPVLLEYKFSSDNSFYANAGPYFGYIFNVEEQEDGTTMSNDITPFFNSFELGFTAGIGKTFSINESNDLFVEIRNNLGLTSLNDNYSIRTNSLNLILGWNFTL
ncbi:porin family protein [uncultured Tenacibaculum sp.]|uniref:porin family protein n=1 Tax=uncultured Tenacibaculum sp. TaxID=174713 RepID=UPI00263744FC|nr:porin family protein [uncultured Tenacibaculum sp.]